MAADHYETLHVAKNANAKQIKAAYRRAAARAHPDRPGGSHTAMVAVARAYETLSDPERRARYDQIGEEGATGPSLDDQALMAFMSLLDMMLANEVSEDADHIEVLSFVVEKNATGAREGIQALERRRKTLEKRRRKFRLKAATKRNILIEMIERKLTGTALELRTLQNKILVCERMKEILRDYDRDQPASEYRAFGGTFTFSAGS